MLWPGHDQPESAVVSWAGGVITEERRAAAGAVIDARGAWILPGIVDLHGDAFERSLMPRSGVPIDPYLALDDNDVQLLAAGITTAFVSVTDSWEPGLRSRATLRSLIATLGRRHRGPDLKLHVRHERCNTADFGELQGWIGDGLIHMLSFNDHTPVDLTRDTALETSRIARSGVDEVTMRRLILEAAEERDRGVAQEGRLASAAADAGCVTASHDAETPEDLERDIDLGVSIAEFPTTIELAGRYRDRGITVMLGAPNLVRGGSHLGNLSVRDAIEAGVSDVLCSDYHYPSLLQAPFTIAALGLEPFGAAWRSVSDVPAGAAGLRDRGRIEHGARADLIVVEPAGKRPARVRAVIVGGRVTFSAP